MKNLLYKFIFWFSMFFLFGFTHASVYIEGWDKQVSYWEYVNLVGNIGDIVCSSYEYDWSVNGWTIWLWNNSQTFNLYVDNDYDYIMFKLKCNKFTHVDDFVSSPIRVTMKTPVVSAWSSSLLYSSWQIVNLSWWISWTPCTVFSYYWEQVSWESVEIENHEAIEIFYPYYNWAKFVYPAWTNNITLKLTVRPSSCYHSMETFSWTVTYYRSTTPPPSSASVSISWWNQTILPNSSINLQAILNNVDESKCNVWYKWWWSWSAIWSLNDYYSKSVFYTGPNVDSQAELKLTVTINHNETAALCESVWVYYANTTILTKAWTQLITQGWWEKINTSKLKAQEFLNNNDILKNKRLSLNYDLNLYPIIKLETDNLQAEWYIEYIFEYSTWINFENATTIRTMWFSTYIYPKMFDNKSLIHFFRVKACIDNICTQYSNILNYIDSSNPMNIYQVKCDSCKKTNIDYMDILNTNPYVLIENVYNNSNCKWTCKMPNLLNETKTKNASIGNSLK